MSLYLDMTIGIGIVEVVLVLFGAVLQQVEEGEGILSELVDFFQNDGNQFGVGDSLCHNDLIMRIVKFIFINRSKIYSTFLASAFHTE